MKPAKLVLAFVIVAGCGSRAADLAPVDQDTADAFARSFLDSIQAPSVAARREFCGYFYRDGDGSIQATPPRIGTFASCKMPAPRPGDGVFASYHTHGAYGEDYDNEVPSAIDLQSDIQLQINGYVSTPGGRVWRVDHAAQRTTQICGLRCVEPDPDFVPIGESLIRKEFTLQDLVERNKD